MSCFIAFVMGSAPIEEAFLQNLGIYKPCTGRYF